MKKVQNTGEPMPNFFLVLDFVVFGLGVAYPKKSGYFFLIPLSNPYIMMTGHDGTYDGLHISTQNYT